MFGIHDFGVFLVTAIVLNLTPGQDTFYILGRTIAEGRRAGLASVLGISSGSLIHTIAAALGLSALIAASASAFLALKLLGAAYLIYLGLRMWFTRTPAAVAVQSAVFSHSTFGSIYRQGLITNVLNPKVALFFLAFMPQFIAADSPHKVWAFITLGLSLVVTGTTWCFCIAWFASRISRNFHETPALSTVLNRIAGGLFVLLGIRLVASK
jgi:RhtB (resistance to homoserine/threonine) family protein